MNRIIKFRGKRIDNGEWVYGSLDLTDNSAAISWDRTDNDGDTAPWFANVDPDTVGQFTGLVDKNGREIYEGDILHAVGGNDATIGKQFYRSVSFVEGCFCLNVTEYNNVSIPLRNHIINRSLNWDIASNIHDNPELLNEK